ncbi:MAG: hypothetical protein L0154_30925 [Chloroflexi bacterium]|nr:hypothetical protein [Chloroflexota bacterium]
MITLDLALPAYAKDMIWLKPGDGPAIQIQAQARVEIPAATALTLHWTHPDGSPLHRWTSVMDNSRLTWDGIVRLGGFVDRSHILEFHGLALMLVELMGSIYLPADYPSLPTLADLQAGPYKREDARYPAPEHWYSLLIDLDSPFADFLHHALVNGNAIDCTASLGGDEGGWHELVGLPLLVESLTLLAPGM